MKYQMNILDLLVSFEDLLPEQVEVLEKIVEKGSYDPYYRVDLPDEGKKIYEKVCKRVKSYMLIDLLSFYGGDNVTFEEKREIEYVLSTLIISLGTFKGKDQKALRVLLNS